MDTNSQNTVAESGNILIYIIGAVFLIGILTVIVKGSTTPGAGIDQEALVLKASQVRSYATELERGVSYVLQNGHSETEISFAHVNASSAYGTYNSNPTAEVFNPSGGGVTWQDNDTDIQTADADWVFSANNEIQNIGYKGGACGGCELIAHLPYVTLDFCNYINTSLGITTASQSPPQEGGSVILLEFDGSFDLTGTTLIDAVKLRGQHEGCFEGDVDPPAGTYHYYKVLLVR